jgi:hypothetical protein
MAAYNKFDVAALDLINGVHKFDGTHTFKVMLSNTAPVATNSLYGDISAAELANGNGYLTGGTALTLTSSRSTAVAKATVSADITFTATGSMGPFRYAIVYNTTPTTPLKPLWCWFDYGSSVTLAATETFTVDFDQTNGLFTET